MFFCEGHHVSISHVSPSLLPLLLISFVFMLCFRFELKHQYDSSPFSNHVLVKGTFAMQQTDMLLFVCYREAVTINDGNKVQDTVEGKEVEIGQPPTILATYTAKVCADRVNGGVKVNVPTFPDFTFETTQYEWLCETMANDPYCRYQAILK